MNAQKFYNTAATFVLCATFFLQGCGGTPQGEIQTRLDGLQSTEEVKNSDELFTEAGEGIMEDDGVIARRKRFVRVNFGVLRKALEGNPVAGTIRLNLFDDQKIDIVIEKFERISDENLTIVGQIAGDPNSAVTLVMNEGVLVANVRRGDRNENFEVRYASNGVHLVRQPERDEDENCPEVETPQTAFAEGGSGEQSTEPTLTEMANERTMADGTPVVKVLAAYTPKARSAQGGESAIKALIQMGVADTNKALEDSGINMKVELVGIMAVTKNETGAWSSDLSKLKGTSDGRWDEVHKERKRLGADQVSLVGSYSGSGTAGIGYRNASYSSAFTITKASAFKQFTFSHELGHNLGLAHDDGYQSSAGRFRTIIAYGSYTRIRRFSNPNRTYNGYRTGTSSRNEAAIINRNAARVSKLVP